MSTIERRGDDVTAARNSQSLLIRRQNLLATGETIRAEDGQLVLTLPVRARFRGGHAAVIDPTGAARNAQQADMALVKAIARAHRWQQMLRFGEKKLVQLPKIANRAPKKAYGAEQYLLRRNISR